MCGILSFAFWIKCHRGCCSKRTTMWIKLLINMLRHTFWEFLKNKVPHSLFRDLILNRQIPQLIMHHFLFIATLKSKVNYPCGSKYFFGLYCQFSSTHNRVVHVLVKWCIISRLTFNNSSEILTK